MIYIIVNGSKTEVKDGMSVEGLLGFLGVSGLMTAVELNLNILDRNVFGRTILNDGDKVEIISFVGGG